MKPYQAKLATPFAVLGVATDQDALIGVDFLPRDTPTLAPQNSLAEQACRQLLTYLADPDFRFRLPLKLDGTPHQQRVWQALCKIPRGQPSTYGDLAKQLGSAPRAVGQACGANPLPVIVPCHRVLSKNGLGGFMNSGVGDPLNIKRWLLEHERNR